MSEKKLILRTRVENLSATYKRRLEKSVSYSLALFCIFFYCVPVFNVKPAELKDVDLSFVVFKLPEYKPPEIPPRPTKPLIPVEADVDEILDNVEIDFLNVQEEWLASAPAAPVQEDTTDIFEFVAVSDKPQLIKSVMPVYPELARQAGITGDVVVKVLIDKRGNVEKAEILKSIAMLDEAALDAARQFKFKPGKQRDRSVKVWMSVPFHFRMRD